MTSITGSKGDYIFRDQDEAGIETVSIMFEMKDESDATASRKKNEVNSTKTGMKRAVIHFRCRSSAR